jgi:glycosyltransferase involved in cell wall biosynthesis
VILVESCKTKRGVEHVISFAIVTGGNNDHYLQNTVKSILDLDLESFEVIIVGRSEYANPSVKCVAFDESVRDGWITRKKNLAVSHSQGEIVVILHDYMKLNQDWTRSNVKALSNSNWDVAMCRITNLDGTRFRDWTLWAANSVGIRRWFIRTSQNLVPYTNGNLTRFMYVSGSVMIVRRDFMLSNPLEENLTWGQMEDVEWSLRVRKFWNYKMFPELSISTQKQKGNHFKRMGVVSRILMNSYSFLVERVLPEPLSSSLEIGFIELISGNPELQEATKRMASLRDAQSRPTKEKT